MKAARDMVVHFALNGRRGRTMVAVLEGALSALQEEIIRLLAQVGDMDADDIQTRLCVASNSKFDAAMQGLKHRKIVMYRGQANDGCWRLLHNPLAKKGDK